MISQIRTTIQTLIFSTALPSTVFACGVCFGDKDSALTKGLSMGILTLLTVLCGVLGVIAVCLFLFIKRSKLMPS